MSWQLGASSVLALALAVGFAWYERSRPDARLIALIASLAAFAALGRVAFAALPNVKPTTDIVLITGYALGGAPGFAVGAVAGLSSNFFFGQGPWTPWQMAGWAATGLIGAGLAVLPGRRLGRAALAVACGVTGFAFTALQDVGDWVNFSDHRLPQLSVYVGKGLGFDALHAGACVAFALALGPALRRSIERFSARLEIRWLPAGSQIPCTLAALVLGVATLGTAMAPSPARGATTPVGYLLSAENRDGGLGAAPGQLSSPLFSGWAALGLAAAGRNPATVAGGGRSLLAYVSSHPAGDPGALERTILVLGAAGRAAPAGRLPASVGRLRRDIAPDGSVNRQVNWTAFAILAFRAAGVPAPARTMVWLLRQQDRDGGFSFAGAGASSDVDDTGSVLEALAGAGGRASEARRRAVAYLRVQQDRDGGFAAAPGAGSNAQSTSWAIQGLIAAGVGPDSLRRGGAPSPSSYLRSLLAPDGHVRYSRGSDQTPVWVTGQALMALQGRALPLTPVAVPAARQAPAHRPRPPAPRHRRRAAPSRAARRVEKRSHPHVAASGAAGTDGAVVARTVGFLAAVTLAPVGL